MCGIVGIIGTSAVSERLLRSLKKLEYRGYDSAGIATVNDNDIQLRKVVGKIASLEEEINRSPISGETGIGHTRWATHGAPEQRNAHPFKSSGIALVHNGIIENHQKLKYNLISKGYEFESDTDSEVILKLLEHNYKNENDEVKAVKKTFRELEGAFAVAVVFSHNKNLMIGMRKGAPLAVGIGEEEMYLGSDALALSDYTNKIAYLDDGEYAVLTRKSYDVFNQQDKKIEKQVKEVSSEALSATKGHYEHYMLKEIYDQPRVVAEIFDAYYDANKAEFKFSEYGIDVTKYSRVYIIACGTSYHAALTAKYWIEKFARVPVEVDFASEFRYREPVLSRDSAGILISQSGETADTLAALRHLKQCGVDTIALVNVEESTIAHEARFVLPLHAGFEIGVASTKAFTAQLMVLAQIALEFASKTKNINKAQLKNCLNQLHELPDIMHQVFLLEDKIKEIALQIKHAHNVIYVGRGTGYPAALEGALKFKEISYIHAEGIAAGELKHGHIALIDEKMPVIVIAPHNEGFAKVASNVQEICARRGYVVSFTDLYGEHDLRGMSKHLIKLPATNDLTAPIVYSVPMQMLAYHAALALGNDVDQPRNLAKSVTVE